MIRIMDQHIAQYGGFLNALNHASFSYLHEVLKTYHCFKPINNLSELDQIILHIDPHLDEYFASLLLLSSLPYSYRKTAYKEVALTSEYHNPQLLELVPHAAIFGIGSVGKLGEKALFSFDEHVQGDKRRAPSCTSLVEKMRFNKNLPQSFREIIQEVNEIDSSGGDHEQSIGNIIKRGHEIRLVITSSNSPSGGHQDWLTPFWKWTIMNACLTATIYCLENEIEWRVPSSMESIRTSLAYFTEHSNFSEQPEFEEVTQWMRKSFHGQETVFNKAVLRRIKHSQTLVLGKVCLSLNHCFGPKITNAIMVHFWEIIYHNQRNYIRLTKIFDSILTLHGSQISMNNFGFFEKRVNSVRFLPSSKKPILDYFKIKLWILFIEPLPSATNINQVLNSLLKKYNHGFGFIYIWNSASGSVALFKGSGIPLRIWGNLKDVLKKQEPNCWHDEGFDHFILNGNKTHQYVERTNIALDELENIIRRLK